MQIACMSLPTVRYLAIRIFILGAFVIALQVIVHYYFRQFKTKPFVQNVIRELLQDQERKHIGFLKVHKAASSTLQNIFIRFGLQRNLTFIIPNRKKPPFYSHVISTYRSLTEEDIEPHPYGRRFDILCHHVIYNRTAWANFLQPDVAIIGSVRAPESHFVSVLNYFRPRYIQYIPYKNKVRTFLRNPNNYEAEIPYSSTNNRMSFEFGVAESVIMNRNLTEFTHYLKHTLAKQFQVVVIVERFDESLVMMKRKLNWHLKDIIYVRKNSNKHGMEELNLDAELRTLLRRHNVLDFLLYDFFYKRLEQQIDSEGKELFTDELDTFRVIRTDIVNFCVSKHDENFVYLNATRWNDPFVWTRQECDVLVTNEIELTEILRDKQNIIK